MTGSEPIFIGGLFKSGTTLLRTILGQHPNIAAGLETYWFDLDWDDLSGEKTRERLRRLAVFYSRELPELEQMAAQSPNVGIFITQLFQDYARKQGKARWAEKTPGNIIHNQRLFQLWPNAKLIHVVRDPRDVLASLRRAKKWDDPDYFADLWCKFFRSAEKAKQAPPWCPGHFIEIRYEQLVSDTEAAMRCVIDFTDEPWHPAAGKFEGSSNEFEIVLAATGKASTSLDRLRRPIQRDLVGLFPQVLTKAELDQVRARVKAGGLESVYERIINETSLFER